MLGCGVYVVKQIQLNFSVKSIVLTERNEERKRISAFINKWGQRKIYIMLYEI